MLKNGSYSKMSRKRQELERIVNQFETKEQINRDNFQLRQKRKKLLKEAITFKNSKN
jgi:hypothetical protein